MPSLWAAYQLGTGSGLASAEISLSVRKYVVWLSPSGSGGFTGIFRDAEKCPGFPPPQVALVTVAPGEKGLWVVWCNK